MAKDAKSEIMTAIVARLRADDTVESLVGAAGSPSDVRVFDFVPDNAVFPYVRVSVVTDIPFDTKTEDGMEVDLQVSTFSRGRGDKELHSIQDAILESLDDTNEADFSFTGFINVSCFYVGGTKVPDPDGVTRHGIQTFRVVAEV